MAEVRCSACGSPFIAQRSTARFCSTACRVRSHYRATAAAPRQRSLAAMLRAAKVSGVHPLIGSKGSRSAPAVIEIIRAERFCFDRWVEPFLGSAAMYLEALKAELITPRRAVLNDRNGWMLATLRAIRDQPQELARLVALTPISEAGYNEHPEPDPAWPDVRIALWWLQRTCQGFVGDFRKRRTVVEHSPRAYRASKWTRLPAQLEAMAPAFAGCSLLQQDAIELLSRICTGKARDLVFVDPPYVGSEDVYAVSGFREHRELAALLQRLPAAGVVVTYYDHPLIRELYPPDAWQWHEVERSVVIVRREGQRQRDQLSLI